MRKWEEEESLGAYLELNPGPPDSKEGMLTITPWMTIMLYSQNLIFEVSGIQTLKPNFFGLLV